MNISPGNFNLTHALNINSNAIVLSNSSNECTQITCTFNKTHSSFRDVNQLKILNFVLLGALDILTDHLGLDPILCGVDQWRLLVAAGVPGSDDGRVALADGPRQKSTSLH